MSLNTYNSQTKQLTPIAGNARNVVQGATSSANGVAGLVPQPLIADKDKFLKGDGTWATPEGGGSSVIIQNGVLNITNANISNGVLSL